MKVISGAQVGADIAGLRAARACGIETGGYMPKHGMIKGGFLPRKEIELYGLQCLGSPTYPPRTRANVRHSHGTIRLASTFNSRGEIVTKQALDEYGKPHLDIPITRWPGGEWKIQYSYRSAANWLYEARIETVNIAGNANPDFEGIIQIYLEHVFNRWINLRREHITTNDRV